MDLLQRFRDFVSDENLFTAKDGLLLAVSGGVDSVVLCDLCYRAGYNFTIAHCNFQLRGEESKRDRLFAKQLADQYQVPFLVKDFDTQQYASQGKLSVQEAARELRYTWFEEITHHSPLTTHILTAHHLDDNIETMLMHFFRGTGIHGLRGMLPKQGKIVRPLLFARKEELKQFATENNLSWVEDSSNATDKYSRNYFRHQVIPLVQTIYPQADHNLANNLQRFADMEVLYEQAVERHKKKLLETRGQEVHIPVLKLKKANPLTTIVYELIKDFGFSAQQTGEVINLLDSESGRFISSSTHRIIKNRNWLIIAPLKNEQADHILIEEADREIAFREGRMEFNRSKSSDSSLPTDSLIACLDTDSIKFPLLLRKWKQGDYFYPLGMKKKKKLARFFIDQKLSLTDKEKVWVLEMDKKIIWVAGMRIDERFKVTAVTKTILQVKLTRT